MSLPLLKLDTHLHLDNNNNNNNNNIILYSQSGIEHVHVQYKTVQGYKKKVHK